ncbi:restriction endonuclease subunit S [Candidatus Methylobacter oryzae]|uniref:Restriction endonuclease subunit S n=1 Tax=Candidatus Methylobacter oryzae TaxID=2497749 RepID=A0ABY3CM49_9GAMM|nr:restriction endonuclease subunit S [Candidatus Methylobacter oryzae]TRX03022.1 restriction endonuclease subunit S [Candidatus Methylobacter oryzae]
MSIDRSEKITDLVDFNPKRLIQKGHIAPFVDMAALSVDSRDISVIDERQFNGGGAKFKNGDTLFARITPCLENGKTAKISGLSDKAIAHGSTEFIVMAAKDPIYDEDYVYYLARLPEFRSYAQARMEGTSGRQRVSWQSLAEFKFDFPPKETRRQIGAFLKSIDDKIALNTQTNQTLEAIAQAIFKSWFVDFEPVKAKMAVLEAGGAAVDAERAAMSAISGKDEAALSQLQTEQPDAYAELAQTAGLFPAEMQDSELGEIPEGWEAKALGYFLEIKRGGSPRPIQDFMVPTGYPWVKIADATADKSPFLFETKEFIKEKGLKKTVYLKKGALILTNSATPGLPKFLELDACIHDGWLYFPEKRVFSDAYLYFLFLKIRGELIAQGNGSVFTNLKTDILRNQIVLVPSLKVIETFTKSVASILENMKSNCIDSRILSNLRDTLLPKLLSGELTLPQAENVSSEPNHD